MSRNEYNCSHDLELIRINCIDGIGIYLKILVDPITSVFLISLESIKSLSSTSFNISDPNFALSWLNLDVSLKKRNERVDRLQYSKIHEYVSTLQQVAFVECMFANIIKYHRNASIFDQATTNK